MDTNIREKKASMQDEADRFFDLQMSIASKAKGSDRTSLVLFLAFIFVFGALILILPDKSFSEQENRALQKLPALSSSFDGTLLERIEQGKFLDRYFSGKFSEEIADYYADQFPMRDAFVGLKGIAEIALFKGENNDVVLGEDGQLLSRMDDPDISSLEKNYALSESFADRMAETDIPVTFAVAGRVIDVMGHTLPALYPKEDLRAPWDALDAVRSDDDTLSYVDLESVLRAHAEDGEAVMYKTDHHWTTYGAYLAYVEIMKSFGMDDEILPASAFTVEVATTEFYGTAWRNAGMKWIKPEKIEFWRFAGDEDYTMTVNDTGKTFSGFYDRSYLEKTDKYSAFISGNNSYVTIEKNGGEDRERLLLVKDSFGHSLAPFLAYHFDLEILDLRYYKLSVASLVETTGCSRVLIINNMASLTDTGVVVLKQLGAK